MPVLILWYWDAKSSAFIRSSCVIVLYVQFMLAQHKLNWEILGKANGVVWCSMAIA